MFGFGQKTLCPQCQMGKEIPANCAIRMCKKCLAAGYDYQMFKRLDTQSTFLIVYIQRGQVGFDKHAGE